MKEFEFEFQEKVSCWVVRTGKIRANTKKEARLLIKKDQQNSDIEYDTNEYLTETEEVMELDNSSIKIQEI